MDMIHTVPEKSLTKKKLMKKERKKNEQIKILMLKQYVADSLIHSTDCNTLCLYQISKY